MEVGGKACGVGHHLEVDPYPVTVVRARYSGAYEPGEWRAFPLSADDLPAGWAGGDPACVGFWQSYDGVVGAGSTPQAAYDDLVERLPTQPQSGPS